MSYEKILNSYRKLFRESHGQGSAEMILLMGAILAIVLVAGTYIIKISSTITNSFENVIKAGRDSIISKI